MIANNTSRPCLIYVLQGQLIIKNKQQQQILESGSMYNVEGFIYNQSVS